MAYHVYKVRAIFNANTDRSKKLSNQFVFDWNNEAADPLTADFVALETALEGFYNTAHTGATHAMGGYLGHQVDRTAGASELEWTDITSHLNGSAAGSPFRITAWTVAASLSAGSIPDSSCAVLAFRAAYGTDPEFGTHTRPRADDRGRIYLGPLNDYPLQFDSETPPNTVLSAAFGTDAYANLQGLYNAVNAITGGYWTWVQWSRAMSRVQPVVEVAADALPANQRRRADARGNLSWVAA